MVRSSSATQTGGSAGWRYGWVAPASLLGLCVALPAWAMGATARVVDGVLEVAGGRLAAWACAAPAPFGFAAITLGHVVLGESHDALAGLRPHEHAHVRQYERWGLLFFVLYFGSSAYQWLRGNSPYLHNHFERQARAEHARAVTQAAAR